MRVHQNFVESLPAMLTIILVCGLYTPEATIAIAAWNCVSRIIYVAMYLSCGPDKRIIGAVSGSGPLYGLLLYTMGYGIYELAQ